jgi:hypothetical protein
MQEILDLQKQNGVSEQIISEAQKIRQDAREGKWQARIMGNPPEPKNSPKHPVWILITALVTAII